MKYALFEFTSEKSCEIGETRWIDTREDRDTFKNDSWNSDKEVMVAWPTDIINLSKKIVRGSIDPDAVQTKTFVAKIVIFDGKY